MGQAAELASLCVKVCGGEPTLKGTLAAGPLGVEHGVPGGVAAAPLYYHVLTEDTLEGESEALGCSPRGEIERIALPLVASIGQLLEDVSRQEIDGFGCGTGSLQLGREQDVADFDDSVGRVDPHEAGVAGGALGLS